MRLASPTVRLLAALVLPGLTLAGCADDSRTEAGTELAGAAAESGGRGEGALAGGGEDAGEAHDAPPPALDPVIEPGEAPPPSSRMAASGDERAVRGGGGAAAAGPMEGEGAGASPGPAPVRIPSDRPRFERPEHVRGIYLSGWTAGSSRRVDQLVDLARRTEINTFIIDIKEVDGHVSYASGVPAVRAVGAADEPRIGDLPGLLRRLESEGIYPVARVVVVKDALLVEARPELAVQDTAGGVWVDSNGIRWLDAFDRRVWEYHVDLAREVARLGFPAIQWDYVRFADAPRSDLRRAVHARRDGRTKERAIRQFLEYSRQELAPLGVAVMADVFGVTTSARDVGIGQVWEEFIDVVDAALPMIYPSHYYRGSFGYERPNARPYEIVTEALERGVARSEDVEGAGRIIPWLQDFSLGEPDYGAPEVRAQIQAAYDVGIDEWVLWNPASRYTEEALEPVGGWVREPTIRVAGTVVPVSRRQEAIRMARAEAAARDSVDAARAAAAEAAAAQGDTVGGGGG